jgi:hypothetical protein
MTIPTPIRPPLPRAWRSVEERLATAEPSTYVQGSLALSFPLSSGLDAVPSTAAVSLVTDRSASGRADAEPWAARFVQAIVEVVAGHRPSTQILRFTSTTVYSDVARRAAIVASAKAHSRAKLVRPQVATVHVYHPDGDSAEVAARVVVGGRSRAIAARLELKDNRWTCTAIQFG